MSGIKKLQAGVSKLGTQVRFLTLNAAAGMSDIELGIVDEATRTVSFSFSSETPILGEYGMEILSHSPGAGNLQRIDGNGSLLFNHEMGDLLGVVEKAWLGSDRRCYCTARFSTDERGEWAMQRVIERTLLNVSFKYSVSEIDIVDAETYVAVRWTALEVSLVTVPGDASVGMNRSASDEEMDVVINDPETGNPPAITPPASADNLEGSEMKFKNKHVKQDAANEHNTGGGGPAQVDPAAIEAARVTEIDAMCRTHQISDDMRNNLISLRAPIESARGIVLNHILARSNGQASLTDGANPDMTNREKANYSLVRAINACVNERMGNANAWKEAGFEREVSQSIGQRSGKQSAGLFMPTNITFYGARAADYSFGTGAGLSATSGGSNMVATNLLAGSFIDMLRNRARVFGLGAQMLSGLTGNVDIPRQKSAGQVYWVGEGGSLPQTGAQFDKVSLSPKHLGALSIITRNMLQQSTPYIEQLVRADMIQTMALGIDAAALFGTGASSQPLGIANQAGIGSVIGGTNGGALTIDNLIDLETAVAVANADEGTMAYLTNAKAVGALKKLKSSTGQYLWTNSPMGQRSVTPGEINGYSVARTNQARSNLTKGTGTNLSEVYFGDWSQLLVGEWGVVEILPNPYAAGVYEAGAIELRVLQTIDIAVRHAQSFAIMSDAIA